MQSQNGKCEHKKGTSISRAVEPRQPYGVDISISRSSQPVEAVAEPAEAEVNFTIRSREAVEVQLQV